MAQDQGNGACLERRRAAQKPLVVTSEWDRNVELSTRNIPGAVVAKSMGLNVYDVLTHTSGDYEGRCAQVGGGACIMDARDIVIRPIVTEKSTDLMASQNKYTFQVALKANKTQIKDAVEELFKVKVRKVNTSRVRGKLRRMGRFEGRTPDWKKAVVTLEPGHTIEVFEGL